MHLSQYLKAYPYPDAPGYLLLFSTKKASLSLVPEDVYRSLAAGGKQAGKAAETLAELGMLVADLEVEKREVAQFNDEVNRINPGMNITVVLGLDCNFACRYCYEGTMKGDRVMSDETAERLIAFIKERFRPGKKKLTLYFYGGETLLYADRIKYISRALKPFVEEQGAAYEFTAVTNGSLLSRKRAGELVRYGLNYAKVTVDGPPENHNYFRPFKNGQGSFDVIVKNLKEACEVVEIGLGGNFTRENYHLFPTLLDRLEKEGLGPDKLSSVKFNPVTQTSDAFALPDFSGGCNSINEPWLAEASVLLREEVLKRGYKSEKITPSPCAVDVADAFTVHYDGSIYKCGVLVGHEQFKVGDVWQGMGDFREIYNVDYWKKEEKCRECVYLPLCFGGCRYMRYQRTGGMDGVDCRKEYYDVVLEKMLLQEVRYRQK